MNHGIRKCLTVLAASIAFASAASAAPVQSPIKGAAQARQPAERTGRVKSFGGHRCGFLPAQHVPSFFSNQLSAVLYEYDGNMQDDRKLSASLGFDPRNPLTISHDCRTLVVSGTEAYKTVEIATGSVAIHRLYEGATRKYFANPPHLFTTSSGQVLTWYVNGSSIWVVDIDTGEKQWTTDIEFGPILAGDLSTDGKFIAYVWGTAPQELLVIRKGDNSPSLRLSLRNYTYIESIDISWDGNYLLIVGSSPQPTVTVLDMTGKMVKEWSGEELRYGGFVDLHDVVICGSSASFRSTEFGPLELVENFSTDVIDGYDQPITFSEERYACSFAFEAKRNF